jgi:enoyl-CoA hydratase/carnithine racemase
VADVLLVEVAGRVATLTLNRPEVRNAINLALVDALHAALGALEARDDVDAVVVRGAGGKAFASGADIAELRDRRRADAYEAINGRVFARLEKFPRPRCDHAIRPRRRCELALACDFRVAGTSSRLGQPEVGLGIMAAAGGTPPACASRRTRAAFLFPARSWTRRRRCVSASWTAWSPTNRWTRWSRTCSRRSSRRRPRP